MTALLLGMLAWWAQRDAYRMGREQGRLDERLAQLERLRPRERHLYLVRPDSEGDDAA